MSDSNKHWKETIGTGVAPRPLRPGPRPGAPPARPAAPGVPSDGDDALPRPTRRAAVAPGTIAVGSLSAEMPAPLGRAKSAAQEALELVLAELPVGSISFTEQVGARLWPDPRPAEVRDLARLLVARNQVQDLAMRDALTRAVSVRQRTRRLQRLGPEVPIDATAFAARAHEWSRLAEVAGEIRFVLQSAPTPRGADAVEAALALLPDPLELAAEAEVARAAAGLIGAARGETARGAHQDPPPVDDAISLLGAVKEDRPRPGDALLLEIWAACSLARRDLPLAERTALENDRRALALVDARAEASLVRAVESEGADREAARRMLTWRRYLVEMTDRVKSRLDPPKPAAAPAPGTTPPAGSGAAADSGGSGGPAAAKPDQGLIFRATTKLMGLLKR
ncbi:MAG: hypothetical protein MUF27_02955 [Acidobacteria bacterium]|jgi:hypothetical protein|nr:hypothetical protein [Acidobacteriota bacterium]